MKVELEVVRFDVSDIVTTSACDVPEIPYPAGDGVHDCGNVFG